MVHGHTPAVATGYYPAFSSAVVLCGIRNTSSRNCSGSISSTRHISTPEPQIRNIKRVIFIQFSTLVLSYELKWVEYNASRCWLQGQ